MSLFICSLNSGSNGNCYYVGNENEAILIDAGLSCRETEKRMKRSGLSMLSVKALFISHEHADHIRGVELLSKKYRLPVYISDSTLKFSGLKIDEDLRSHFNANHTVTFNKLSITSFTKFHDAADPCSFIITCEDVKVGVFTDIGRPCENLIKHFKQCHSAFLESNYDEEMLENGSYPYHLKRRIRGGMGHLSNNEALQLFVAHRPTYMTHLFLSHLSKNNNCPDLARKLFTEKAGEVKVIVASRYEETSVYHITREDKAKQTNVKAHRQVRRPHLKIQLSLFPQHGDVQMHA